MTAVLGDPSDERPLDGHGAGNGKGDLQPPSRNETAVGEEPVESNRETVSGHEVQRDRKTEVEPSDAATPKVHNRKGDQRERKKDQHGGADHLGDQLPLAHDDFSCRLINLRRLGLDRAEERGHVIPFSIPSRRREPAQSRVASSKRFRRARRRGYAEPPIDAPPV
jgi:hypothetical protein